MSAPPPPATAGAGGHPRLRRLGPAGFLVGFALGGFLDGILLHQILQWHHLLSGQGRPPLGDLRAHMLADGLFHAALYVALAVGLAGLVRGRAALAAPGGAGRLLGWAAAGFGSWHVLDALLNHWLLGLHRIRTDAGPPILWDLLFLALGLAALAYGASRLRRADGARGDGPGGGRVAAAGLAALALAAAPAAALPSRGGALAAVALPPGLSEAGAFALLVEAGARPVGPAAPGPAGDALWLARLDGPGTALRLLRRGALAVGTRGWPAGCFGYVAPA